MKKVFALVIYGVAVALLLAGQVARADMVVNLGEAQSLYGLGPNETPIGFLWDYDIAVGVGNSMPAIAYSNTENYSAPRMLFSLNLFGTQSDKFLGEGQDFLKTDLSYLNSATGAMIQNLFNHAFVSVLTRREALSKPTCSPCRPRFGKSSKKPKRDLSD